ncbi:WYL domain-containing protein [Flavobacteriaceae bacterium Ap0902]|nr:WYL domain-containing protein [Flavobacteriaceae bacterium Ap0902]
MSKSSHAHIRYNILDYCFREKAFNFKELLDYLNQRLDEHGIGEAVSERTLRDDIKVFRDKKNGFDAPLPDGKRVYQYTDKNFSIAQRPLLEYEQYLLNTAQELLERFENDPKYDRLAEALLKVQDDEYQDDESDAILYYDHNDEYKGIKLLKPFYHAIRKKQVLQITYQGFKDTTPTTFEFHPYILKQYNRRWFVFGRNNDKDIHTWSIPLDERLVNFKVLKDKDYIDSNIDWDTYFNYQVGIVRPLDANVEKVVLKFYNGREAYFKTKPFFPNYDEFFEDDKQDQVWFETIINRELIQQILSYGEDVEVLEPASLREVMRCKISTLNKRYR